MTVDFSPKKQFLANETAAKELAQVVQSGNFAIAATAAMTDFVMRCNPTHEEIVGARRFLLTLMSLPFKDAPPPEFPVRKLDQSAYERPRPVEK